MKPSFPSGSIQCELNNMPPRRAREQIDAGSQPSVRVRRRVSRRLSGTAPSLRTPIFSRFCGGRRRASRAPKAICALLRCEVENCVENTNKSEKIDKKRFIKLGIETRDHVFFTFSDIYSRKNPTST